MRHSTPINLAVVIAIACGDTGPSKDNMFIEFDDTYELNDATVPYQDLQGGNDFSLTDEKADFLSLDTFEAVANDLDYAETSYTDITLDVGTEAQEVLLDQGQTTDFCRSFYDCGTDEVCIFSEGICERRSNWIDATLDLYGFHPRAGTVGDVLVIDGARFYSGFYPSFSVLVGSNQKFSGMQLEPQPNQNRVTVFVGKDMSGFVTIVDSQGKKATSKVSFQVSSEGLIACDGSTPSASNIAGQFPTETGPYAAGYVDVIGEIHTRVYYPAMCGSVRRPPVPGTWPLVCILHGNGALNIQYEYLAELLATWGFVSFAPATKHNSDDWDAEEMLSQLLPVIGKMRGKSLEGIHPLLVNVSTTPEIAFIGHSRGAGRAEEAINADPDLKAHTIGSIFLGPVDDDKTMPGPFMLFAGGKDRSCYSPWYEKIYKNQNTPRWMIEIPGGNHGGFCDHKVYGYENMGLTIDLEPTIPRRRQLEIVQTFAIPFLQRVFALEEPFAYYLNTPPSSPDYKVQFDK